MKKYFFIFIVLFYADTAFSHSHYPITRDSLEAIKNGKYYTINIVFLVTKQI